MRRTFRVRRLGLGPVPSSTQAALFSSSQMFQASSSSIVAKAVERSTVMLGSDTLMTARKFSSTSGALSSSTVVETCLAVSPGAKVTDPELTAV